MKKILYILLCLVFLWPLTSQAHPGRTDSSGCHTCRTNCASWGLSSGEYHCHRAKALPQPIEPIKSHRSDTGAGYTTPAPEYKIPKIEAKKTDVPKTAPIFDTNNDKEKALIEVIDKMPKTTQTEKISLFQKIFKLIFGN